MNKYFAIRPVRNITPEYQDGIETQIKFIESQGHIVYDPIRDTNQSDANGYRICSDNLEAIKNCDEILFMWDGKSQGCLFDLGMAFALGKPIQTVIGYVPGMTPYKSFQNMVFAWEERDVDQNISDNDD